MMNSMKKQNLIRIIENEMGLADDEFFMAGIDDVVNDEKECLVDLVLPTTGSSIAASDYREELEAMGYNKWQALGSVGGAINGGSLACNNHILTRL